MIEREVKPVWTLEAELGEGPVWVERDRSLWFVDIKKHKIHRYVPLDGTKRSWDAPEQVGFVFPAEDGGFVAGLQSGLYRFDEFSGRFELLVEVEADKPANRLNDGVVDPSGRLWFGTMDNNEKEKTGAFYSFYKGELTPTPLTHIEITNGPAVSPDGKTLYFVDTLAGTIVAADAHSDGTVGERKPFVTIDAADGHPDGPTIDSEGCLWISLYGGWEARRYAPNGDLITRVKFPVENITKLAFGGDELTHAFATTARQNMTAAEIAKQPLIGDLFEFRVEVAGVPCPLVRC